MPNWKKLIVSGSDAALNSLTVTTSVTATSFTGSFSGSFTAPGSTTQVLYNSGGVVSAASGLVYSGSNVGIGTTSPDGKLHIFSGTAGTVTPNAAADDFVIENSGHTGMSILSPDASSSIIRFGSPSDQDGAEITWNYDASMMTIATSKAGAAMNIRTGNEGDAVRITSGGNTLIGTTTDAGYLLDVNGTGRFSGALSGTSATFSGNVTLNTVGAYIYTYGRFATSGGNILFNNGTGENLILAETATNVYTFGKGSAGVAPTSNVLSLNLSTGNVGIGTTGPATLLTVNGAASATQLNVGAFTATDYGTGLQVTSANGVQTNFRLAQTGARSWDFVIPAGTSRLEILDNGGTASMAFLAGGNVGIGTTSPQAKLDIAGDLFMNNNAIWFRAANNYINSPAVSTLALTTAGSERVRIDSTGNVGIGTTVPGAKLVISSGATAVAPTLGATTGISSIISYDNSWGTVFGMNSINGNGWIQQQRIDGTGTAYDLLLQPVGGNVGIGTTTPSSKLSINGGLHVGGDSDAGDNNLLVDGTMGVTGIGTFSTDVTIAGTLTVQTIVAQTITSSISFITGSTKFGSLLSNTHQFTGSVSMTGSLAFNDTLTTYTTLASSAAGSNTLFTQATGSYTSAFFKYTATSASNARSGEVVAIWNGATTEYADYSTVDIGTTNNVTASVSLAAANVLFSMQTNSASWKIKSIATYM